MVLHALNQQAMWLCHWMRIDALALMDLQTECASTLSSASTRPNAV
jgi:hypothetical protein